MSDKKTIFIVKISREYSLNLLQVEKFINNIKEENLDEAIKIYKEYGITELIEYVKSLKEK